MAEKRTIHTGRDHFEQVGRDVYTGPVYTGTVIVQRNGREIRVPLQLPPRAEHFTGREHELAQLLQNLQPGRVVTLCGPGGIGKSALAAEAIWQITQGKTPPESFPDGVIWHSFYTEPQADLALENIARVFGEEPRPTPRDAAQRALAGRQVLVLLDGSEDADDLGNVLAVTSTCGVIVTSRSRHDAVAERQDLQALPLEEAVTLLRAWGKARAADDTVAPRICELVGGVPLAVRLVGRYVNETGETAAEYLVHQNQREIVRVAQQTADVAHVDAALMNVVLGDDIDGRLEIIRHFRHRLRLYIGFLPALESLLDFFNHFLRIEVAPESHYHIIRMIILLMKGH